MQHLAAHLLACSTIYSEPSKHTLLSDLQQTLQRKWTCLVAGDLTPVVKSDVDLSTQHGVQDAPDAVHLCQVGVVALLLHFGSHVAQGAIPTSTWLAILLPSGKPKISKLDV